MTTDLVIKGARVHNLKNISLTLPRGKYIVFTGLSGSGKSSLAFDTIYAEGHRRFVESLSSYARMFLGQLDKPDVDLIEGLSPAISIDQKTTSKNPRSTVGTVTEIYDYLRLLYARIGVPHCPICGEVISQQSVDEIVDKIMALEDGTRFMVLAPVISAKKGLHEKVIEDAMKSGYVRARVDGNMYELTEKIELDKNKKHDIDIVVDRLIMRKDTIHTRLTDSIETASGLSGGIVKILIVPDEGDAETSTGVSEFDENEMVFSQNYACKTHGISLGELAPRMFSFNSPFGACESCGGLGENYVVSPDKLIPDRELSLFGGAIICNGFKSIESNNYFGESINAVGRFYNFDIHKPIKDFSPEALDVLYYGNLKKKRPFDEPRFEGIVNMVKRRYDTNTSYEAKEYYEEFMENVPCPDCQGRRLKKESLAVTVGNRNIQQLCEMSISDLKSFFDRLRLTKTETAIAKEIKKEKKYIFKGN